jgi:predicted dehydrogenase
MHVVVYGAGYWGVNYLRELGARVVSVVEPNEDRAEYVRQRFGVSVEPEFGGVDHDAVIISTPPDTHVDLALPHLEAGKLALIEKPLAHIVEDAAQLYPYRDQIMSGLVYLYHPAVYYEMPDWLRTNPVEHVMARRSNCGPVRPWANAMWDLAPHEVSIFNYLFGHPERVVANGTRDWACLHLDYATVPVLIYVSWCGHYKVRLIDIVPPVGLDVGYTFDDMTWSMEVSPLRRMLDAFIDRDFSRASYQAGLDVVRVLSAAQVSMEVREEVCCGSSHESSPGTSCCGRCSHD